MWKYRQQGILALSVPLCAASINHSTVLWLCGSSRLAMSRERASLGALELYLGWWTGPQQKRLMAIR